MHLNSAWARSATQSIMGLVCGWLAVCAFTGHGSVVVFLDERIAPKCEITVASVWLEVMLGKW